MTEEQYLKNLQCPTEMVDVVIDTDAFNEIDDQFAISFLLHSKEKLNIKALYAAPFFNAISSSPADGMEKSYCEIKKLLDLAGEQTLRSYVFKGSDRYLSDEKTPVISDAATDLANRAEHYSAERPLYVVAIGAITNIASAMLIKPEIKEKIVVVWLGGHALHYFEQNASEFNMRQDIAAARVVMASGVPFVQLPCKGVVSSFIVSGAELIHWLKGKNDLADYLAENTIKCVEGGANRYSRPWTRVIWDVTAVAWLLNENDKFMKSRIVPVRLPGYDLTYESVDQPHKMCYVEWIERDRLMQELFDKLV